MESNLQQISLPRDLCDQVQARYVGERFASLEELLIFVMQALVHDDAAQLDAQEQAIIEQRLHDLGYL